jgi:hypothetical protein
LLREPEIFADLLDIQDAFIFLSPSRTAGFGTGFIPLSEIETYLRLFPTDDIERFTILIRAMDHAYVESVEKRAQRMEKKPRGIQTRRNH